MKTKISLSIFIILLLATTPALFTMDCGEKLTVEKELTEEDGLTVEEIAAHIQQNEGNIEDYSCIIHLNLFFEGEALEREYELSLIHI